MFKIFILGPSGERFAVDVPGNYLLKYLALDFAAYKNWLVADAPDHPFGVEIRLLDPTDSNSTKLLSPGVTVEESGIGNGATLQLTPVVTAGGLAPGSAPVGDGGNGELLSSASSPDQAPKKYIPDDHRMYVLAKMFTQQYEQKNSLLAKDNANSFATFLEELRKVDEQIRLNTNSQGGELDGPREKPPISDSEAPRRTPPPRNPETSTDDPETHRVTIEELVVRSHDVDLPASLVLGDALLKERQLSHIFDGRDDSEALHIELVRNGKCSLVSAERSGLSYEISDGDVLRILPRWIYRSFLQMAEEVGASIGRQSIFFRREPSNGTKVSFRLMQ